MPVSRYFQTAPVETNVSAAMDEGVTAANAVAAAKVTARTFSAGFISDFQLEMSLVAFRGASATHSDRRPLDGMFWIGKSYFTQSGRNLNRAGQENIILAVNRCSTIGEPDGQG